MAIKEILTVPNPVLRQKAKPVARIDKKTLAIIQDLKETLSAQKNPQGVGLSAPQIGKSVKICLVYSRASKKFLVFINPEITWRSKKMSAGVPGSKKSLPTGRQAYEGCLSVPGLWGKVLRHHKIKVRYLTPSRQVVIRKFSGFTGMIAQHEIDHLEGILFIDRVLEQKGKFYKMEKNKEGKEELVEINLSNI